MELSQCPQSGRMKPNHCRTSSKPSQDQLSPAQDSQIPWAHELVNVDHRCPLSLRGCLLRSIDVVINNRYARQLLGLDMCPP